MTKNDASMPSLKDYIAIVGEESIDELKLLASHLKGRRIQHISSKRSGGVSEILNRIVPLMRELGVGIECDTIDGRPDFLNVTRKFHDALEGRGEAISDRDFDIYLDGAGEYIDRAKIKGDVIFTHGLQPIVLIQNKKKFKNKKWVWRCHIDVSSSNDRAWDFISTFAEGYDASLFSSPKFTRPLKIPQFLVCPAIDPLSDKNKALDESQIKEVLFKYGISINKPIISQISRYDYLKDPIGAIEAFRMVKKYIDAQLVLAGSRMPDDAESEKVFKEVKERAKEIDDVHILIIPAEHNDIEINALQRASSVILQKSFEEGFALTVTEALWKEKPVVASAVGGIPLQIKNKYSGLLCHSVEGAALHIRQILQSPELAKRIGRNGRAHIKRNFLITRLIREHMLVVLSLFYEGSIITL